MKKTTIQEKIAFLECLQQVLSYAEDMRNLYGTMYPDGEVTPPTDDSYMMRWNAYNKIIEMLEKQA